MNKYAGCLIMFILAAMQVSQAQPNVKLHPLLAFPGLTVSSSGVLEAGVEYPLTSRITVNQDLGYVFFYKNLKNTIVSVPVTHINGLRSETELRYYWAQGRFYVCPHVLLQETNASRSHSIPVSGEPGMKNEYSVKRREAAFHIKLGSQSVSYAGFVFDFSMGAGLRYISSASSGKIAGYASDQDDYEFPYHKLYDDGSGIFPSLSGSLRVGWSFGKPKKRM